MDFLGSGIWKEDFQDPPPAKALETPPGGWSKIDPDLVAKHFPSEREAFVLVAKMGRQHKKILKYNIAVSD